MTDQTQTTESAECQYCGKELSGDDVGVTYRVLWGKFDDTAEGNVSEKVVARYPEKPDPGAVENWYCGECYREHHNREKGAHYEYRDVDELWNVLEASNGRLVADTKAVTVGGRGWMRVVDGEIQAYYSVRQMGDDAPEGYDLSWTTERDEDFDSDDFAEIFRNDIGKHPSIAYLKSVEETPFADTQENSE